MSAYFDFLKKNTSSASSESPNVSHTNDLKAPSALPEVFFGPVAPVTLIPIKPNARAIATDVRSATGQDDTDVNYLYHERAGIFQYDGELSQSEAERLAYQETLLIYIEETHPTIVATFQNIILNNSGENT